MYIPKIPNERNVVSKGFQSERSRTIGFQNPVLHKWGGRQTLRTIKQALKIGILGAALCCLSVSLLGQSSTEAAVQGAISDPSGAVIPGATVTLKNVGTNIPQSTVTSQSGDYAFWALPAAMYKLLVNAQGFGPQERDNILLTVN